MNKYICPCPNGCNGCELPDWAKDLLADKDKRIAELEAQKKAWKGTAEAYKQDLEHYEVENERLTAVYEAAKNFNDTTSLDNVYVRSAKLDEALAAVELTAALDAVKGFCKHCGATYPHRCGEGRCEKCGVVEELI